MIDCDYCSQQLRADQIFSGPHGTTVCKSCYLKTKQTTTMKLKLAFPVTIEQIDKNEIVIELKPQGDRPPIEILGIQENMPWLSAEQHDKLIDNLHTQALTMGVKEGIISTIVTK